MAAKNISILIVDDEPSIIQSLHGILTDEGFEVMTADGGLKALDIIKETIPDIILLDIWMQDIDGIETLKRIRELDPSVQVIMISGHGTIETAVRAIKLGAYDFIEKPLSLEKLLSSIEKCMSRKEKKVFRVVPGESITARFYESICLYPEIREMVVYLENFCRERFFKVIIAKDWTDIIAISHFISIIDPSIVKKREWSVLFDYLRQVPDTWERVILLSKTLRPKIPDNLRKLFRTMENRDELEQYILYRNKKTLKRMMRQQQVSFIRQRKKDVKEMILNKEGLQREFLISKLAKYYNVSLRTIQRDLAKIHY